MKYPLQNRPYLVFLLLFLFSICPLISRLFTQSKSPGLDNELYKPELSRLNSIKKLTAFLDSTYPVIATGNFDTSIYVSDASRLIKERFHHGSLNYSFSENWIAYLCGKLFWSHMSSIVIPDDILKHEHGLCSQQTIVFMEVLRQKNISVRSVGLGYKEGPGHFLCEVKYNGQWHIHDVSMEPVWSNIANDHLSMDYYLTKKDSLFLVYKSKMPKSMFYKLLEKNNYGNVNEMPAQNMSMFHHFTFILIYLLPISLFGITIRSYRKREKKQELRELAKPQKDTAKTLSPVNI